MRVTISIKEEEANLIYKFAKDNRYSISAVFTLGALKLIEENISLIKTQGEITNGNNR